MVEIHCENDVSADEVRARIRDAYATAQRLQLAEKIKRSGTGDETIEKRLEKENGITDDNES